MIHKLYRRDEPRVERRRVLSLLTIDHPLKTARSFIEKIFQLDAEVCRPEALELCDAFRQLAARPSKITILEVIKPDRHMNNSLEECSIVPPPFHPDLLYRIVTIEKIAGVE